MAIEYLSRKIAGERGGDVLKELTLVLGLSD